MSLLTLHLWAWLPDSLLFSIRMISSSAGALFSKRKRHWLSLTLHAFLFKGLLGVFEGSFQFIDDFAVESFSHEMDEILVEPEGTFLI